MFQEKQTLWALILAGALCALPVFAQQKDPRLQPLAPISGSESSSKASPDGASPPASPNAQMTPDNRPLSGAQQFSLGTPSGGRNIFNLNLHFKELADSNPTSNGTGTDWDSASLLSGEIGLTHQTGRSQFTTSYSGGGSLYNSRSNLSQSYHEASFSEKLSLRRWTFLFADQASYLPESGFGFNGLSYPGGLTGLNSPFFNLNPALNPSQSIQTGPARRISNTVVAEADYALSPRSSWTVSGSVGLLHFVDDGFVDNHSETFSTGYNYLLNPKDTIGVNYSFTRFVFGGQNSGLQSHAAQFGYGRRLTGRLALQLFAGPSFRRFEDPTGTQAGGIVTSWSAGAQMHYQMPRGGISLSYLHGVSGGAGVFAGSEQDELQFSADRQLTRSLTASLLFGYSHNAGIGQLLQSGILTTNNSRYDNWYGGVVLNRPLGRRASLFFDYHLNRQTTNNSICTTPACGAAYLRNQFSVGVDWSLRPTEGR